MALSLDNRSEPPSLSRHLGDIKLFLLPKIQPANQPVPLQRLLLSSLRTLISGSLGVVASGRRSSGLSPLSLHLGPGDRGQEHKVSLPWQFLHLQAEQMKGAVGDWSHTLCPLRSQVFDILDLRPPRYSTCRLVCEASGNVPETPGGSVSALPVFLWGLTCE